MKTQILTATAHSIAQAATLIKNGDLVAFPTETVYGLGANALDQTAVQKIFTAKDRPADNPLIVHIADHSSLTALTNAIPASAHALIDAFWPGPLSIVFLKSSVVPERTTAGLDTVVIRFPSHPVAQTLIRTANTPIAAPSANRSGKVSPTTASDVQADMNSRIPFILDAGDVSYGIESTVIDCTTPIPTLLRPGSITQEMIEAVIGNISTQPSMEVRSPGMKYRHYSPHTPIVLFTGSPSERQHKYHTYVRQHDPRESILLSHQLQHLHQKTIPLPTDVTTAAASLYSSLIAADKFHAKEILVEGYAESAVGTAIMNRLRKAATTIV